MGVSIFYVRERINFSRLFLVRNFNVFLLLRALDTIDVTSIETRAFDIKGMEVVRGRSFTLFIATLCVDNNLLFLTSAEGMFNTRSNSAN